MTLAFYEHDVEMWLESEEEVPTPAALKLLLTGLFQWMRIGEITAVHEGVAGGGRRIVFRVQMTCPPHELGRAAIHMRVTNSQQVSRPFDP